MNILDIGTDIIEVDRIKNSLSKRGDFLKKIFTEREINMFEQKGNNPQTIAGNFAAKEAISKSLGLGIRGYNFKDIEILRNDLGKPVVKTYNNLNQICIQYSVVEIKVSISHSDSYAVASAITITK